MSIKNIEELLKDYIYESVKDVENIDFFKSVVEFDTDPVDAAATVFRNEPKWLKDKYIVLAGPPKTCVEYFEKKGLIDEC